MEDGAAGLQRLVLPVYALLLPLGSVIQRLVAWVVQGKPARRRAARLGDLERRADEIELLVRRRDGIIVDANDRAVQAYGYPREHLVGLHVGCIGQVADRARLELQLQATEEHGGVVFETEHVRRDGSTFPVEVSARACRSGGELYVHSLVRDVSARQAAEAQRRLLESLFANMTEAVIVLDEAFRVKIWSPGAEQLFGWTAAEAVGRSPFSFLIPPEGEREALRAITAAAAGEECTRTMRRLRKDGGQLVASMNIVAVQDGTGAIVGVMAVARDVTAQHAAEAALRDSEARLTLALAASDTEIWEWDLGRGLARIGPRWAALVGALDCELRVASPSDLTRLVHPDDRAHAVANVRDLLRGEKESLFDEVRVPLADGSIRWANLRGRVVARTPEGKPERLIGTVRDVTARRRVEEDRMRLLAQAQEATRAREQILAVVAHDLRGPLAAISSMAGDLEEALGEPDARADLAERGEVIRGAAERMGRLVEDLLDVASIERGSLRLAPELHDCAAIVRDAARAAEPQVRRADVRLEVACEAGLPPALCDRGRILQVLGNLLSNALHATPAGGRVVLRLAAAGGLRFSVQDTGRGFEPGEAERIFQPYQRGAASAYRGAGLGLAIARGIVEGHGGHIWAERPPEGGAAFHFVLPLRGPPPTAA